MSFTQQQVFLANCTFLPDSQHRRLNFILFHCKTCYLPEYHQVAVEFEKKNANSLSFSYYFPSLSQLQGSNLSFVAISFPLCCCFKAVWLVRNLPYPNRASVLLSLQAMKCALFSVIDAQSSRNHAALTSRIRLIFFFTEF